MPQETASQLPPKPVLAQRPWAHEGHPKHLDLMKLPLQRTLFLSGLIIDNYKAANDLAGINEDKVQPPDHSG